MICSEKCPSPDLDLPLELIIDTPADELIGLLTNRVKYIDSHLDRMGDVLRQCIFHGKDAKN